MFIVNYTLYGTTLRQTWTIDFHESVMDGNLIFFRDATVEIVAYVG